MSIQPIVQLYKTTPLGDEMRDWGREETLLAMLTYRFGERPEVVEAAKRLAPWPQAAAAEAILSTTDPALLLTAEPHSGTVMPLYWRIASGEAGVYPGGEVGDVRPGR